MSNFDHFLLDLFSALYFFKNLQPPQPLLFLHFQQQSVSSQKYRGGCGRIFLREFARILTNHSFSWDQYVRYAPYIQAFHHP